MVAGLDPLVVFYMMCDGIQDLLLHDVLQYRGQIDRPVVTWILLPALLVDECHNVQPMGPPQIARTADK